ncbi:hypothetical protein AGMMS49991_11160 [Spirochaetia bacterium]|nr:hypothetical protein AGMMS49991_11160 [Spirochaetia bacterium]
MGRVEQMVNRLGQEIPLFDNGRCIPEFQGILFDPYTLKDIHEGLFQEPLEGCFGGIVMPFFPGTDTLAANLFHAGVIQIKEGVVGRVDGLEGSDPLIPFIARIADDLADSGVVFLLNIVVIIFVGRATCLP